MNKIWLNKSSEKQLILFFNGWGMDENIIRHIDSSGYDICMLNNYNSLNALENSFTNYKSIYIVAWSLGVWVAEQIISNSQIKIDKSIAINGTSLPINDNYGIPNNIFKGTGNNWNNRNKQKFYLRMFGGRNTYEKFSQCLSKRTTLEQKEEIFYLKKEIETRKGKNNFIWDTAICGNKDKIFTIQNQNEFWNLQSKTKTIIIDIPHFPFTETKNWDDIINTESLSPKSIRG